MTGFAFQSQNADGRPLKLVLLGQSVNNRIIGRELKSKRKEPPSSTKPMVQLLDL